MDSTGTAWDPMIGFVSVDFFLYQLSNFHLFKEDSEVSSEQFVDRVLKEQLCSIGTL